MPSIALGQPVPDAPHAVSVSLPSWKDNVGYEEGEDWVLSKMRNGYPRFFMQLIIQAFATAVVKKYGNAGEQAMLFPSHAVASRCRDFLCRYQAVPVHSASMQANVKDVWIVDLVLEQGSQTTLSLKPMIAAVIYPESKSQLARAYWQHTGDGISSRRAEFCYKAFEQGYLIAHNTSEQHLGTYNRTCKGPRRYQKESSKHVGVNAKELSITSLWTDNSSLSMSSKLEGKDLALFVEERFGRNLDMSLAANAKLAIRRRIAGSLTENVDLQDAMEMTGHREPLRNTLGFSEKNIYLYPSGMSSIFNTHRTLLEARGVLKSISFGFPYIDTLKMLEKWGPGCLFYGHGSSGDLDDLENRCKNGEKFLALFCEFPGNPLLKTPDLLRIRRLADEYDFAVVVDETIGNFLNVHVLPTADVVVSSLTKVFSGDSNVMGGSCALNPNSRYYEPLQQALADGYEDNYWPEDAVYMERNSRDFVSRNERINTNAEAICQVLKDSRCVKEIYYPKYGPTRTFYENFRHPSGGYGGLLSVTFNSTLDAVTFFDTLEFAKGPSLGTNFTLCSPYVILAHYHELDWAAQFGVEADLIRMSVGLEDPEELTTKCKRALVALEAARPS